MYKMSGFFNIFKKVFTFLEKCAMITSGDYGIVAQLGERLLRM